jgi:hypothetical protein
MRRPHFHKGIVDLRRLFASNKNNIPILQELLEELAHRKTPDARALMNEVLARFEEIAPDTDETDADDDTEGWRSGELFGSETEACGPLPDDEKRPERLSRMRPLGTAGLAPAGGPFHHRPFAGDNHHALHTTSDFPLIVGDTIGLTLRAGCGRAPVDPDRPSLRQIRASSSAAAERRSGEGGSGVACLRAGSCVVVACR